MRQPVPFGKYLLLDRISVGGMAEVFKAKSYGVEGFEKVIAIKRILPSMGEDRDFIRMFIDEAKIAGQLAHANICQIFELGRIDGSHFIAMEYIWGKDVLQIQNRLRKLKQPMPVPMACFIIAKVAEGLDYAHRRKDALGRHLEIVHRDCSPQNVLISYEGEVKIIDFGIAKAASRTVRTQAGVLKGKFGYMSPEQVRGLPLDRRSDIFALGTMLFELLIGERLFHGETDFSTLERVRNVDIPSPRQLNPDIPPEVEDVVLTALARDVEDRYQWASELGTELNRYLLAQPTVYTGKTLSAWLKDSFAPELERERQALEAFKRIGREALGPAPAVDEKIEDDEDELAPEQPAPMPEPRRAQGFDLGHGHDEETLLGGPNFDDLLTDEPAARAPAREEFAEEAPTEIFGSGQEVPPSLPPAPRVPAAPEAPVPLARERRPSQRVPVLADLETVDKHVAYSAQVAQVQAQAAQAAQAQAALAAQMQMPSAFGAENMQPNPAQPGLPMAGGSVSFGTASPMDGGFPVQSPTTFHGVAPGAGGHVTGPGFASFPVAAPSFLGTGAPGEFPQYPQVHAGSFHPGLAPSLPPGGVGLATTQSVRPAKARSTLARDVGIGVAIAAVALAGFGAVRYLGVGKSPSTVPQGLLVISHDGEPSAQIFVGDKYVAATQRRHLAMDFPAGKHTVRLEIPGYQPCEKMVEIGSRRSTQLHCAFVAIPGGTPKPPPPDAAPAARALTERVDAAAVPPDAQVDVRVDPAPGTSSLPATTTSVGKPAKGMGYLTITTNPPGAKVRIDGADIGRVTPIFDKLELKAGLHRVGFELNDESWTYRVLIESGKTNEYVRTLKTK